MVSPYQSDAFAPIGAGNVTYYRDGRFTEQLGLVTMLKERMVGDLNDYHPFVGDEDE